MMNGLSAEECFVSGSELFERGETEEALVQFRAAHHRDAANARYRSYFGMCLGLAERRFEQGRDLCRSAVKQEFFNPDLYCNLARIHLAFGFKVEGIRYLRRGRMIDPANTAIADELHRLGLRTSPVLQFLPRRHALNRWLGAARHVLARHREVAAA